MLGLHVCVIGECDSIPDEFHCVREAIAAVFDYFLCSWCIIILSHDSINLACGTKDDYFDFYCSGFKFFVWKTEVSLYSTSVASVSVIILQFPDMSQTFQDETMVALAFRNELKIMNYCADVSVRRWNSVSLGHMILSGCVCLPEAGSRTYYALGSWPENRSHCLAGEDMFTQFHHLLPPPYQHDNLLPAKLQGQRQQQTTSYLRYETTNTKNLAYP